LVQPGVSVPPVFKEGTITPEVFLDACVANHDGPEEDDQFVLAENIVPAFENRVADDGYFREKGNAVGIFPDTVLD
jgi:hypothetical protein